MSHPSAFIVLLQARVPNYLLLKPALKTSPLGLLFRIGLLWYHTIIRPFFALDGEEEDAGADVAIRLLDSAQQQYPSSAMFLYFRCHRTLVS